MPSFELFRKQKNQNNKTTTVTAAASAASLSKEEESVASVSQAAGNVEKVKAEQATSKEETVAVEADGVSVEKESTVLSESLVDDNVGQQLVGGGGGKLYLKAMPLRDTLDLEGIKAEVEDGNILILRITPLASKSIEAVKSAVNELYIFTEAIGGDIARLGEERIVICPKNVRIWREKSPFKNSEQSSSLSSTVA
jgi:SepF-like predicted cell division protein (DUF552 family)